MNRQYLYLKGYDWAVTVYYPVTARCVDVIMSHLHSIGCRGDDLMTAWRNLSSGKWDTGLTYSDYKGGRSVVVVGVATTFGELMNSVSHEIHHLSVHIAEANDLDLRGEEVCYIDGKLTQLVYETPIV